MRLGIDEAGRGPVLGPLVVAAVQTPLEDDPLLERRGVDDSKALSATKRRSLFSFITERYECRAVYVSAHQIDEALTTPTSSLTSLEHDVMADLIDAFSADEVIVDAPSKESPWGDDAVTYEHGADASHLVVGAASIVAKVLRDKAIRRIEDAERCSLGSGYPSDPVTKAYLDEASLTEWFVRERWASVEERKRDRGQRSLDSFDDEA